MAKGARVGGAQALRVAGLGASAGGLDPLRELIAQIPIDSGLAIVVLQHLPPSQTGLLANLLASTTQLPVLDASTGQRLSANTIYVVPPHTFASLARGAIVLRRAESGGRPDHPIDDLFRSLAVALGARAIGVVLSGSANDGADGLRAIRAAGGTTFVQDPATAQFDEMPRNAIAAETTHAILSPTAIGQRLGKLAPVASRSRVPDDLAEVSGLSRVFEQLRAASGIDFASYKRSTVERRLARGLARHHLASYEQYSAFLTEHPEETIALYEDLLIHVTEFFRDAPILDKLATLFVDAVRDRAPDVPIRVWIPGCSTGEEVYSLAMLLVEKLGERRTLQLFGTDLSERSIETARIGRYPLTIRSHVSDERLERFFHREPDGYRIRREIRERCVFARHDLVSDPPFSKLDLVSCRNLLIYLGSKLQKRVIPIVHYALNQPGFLLLGRAESIGDYSTLFTEIDSEARIYGRKPTPRTGVALPSPGRRAPIRPHVALRSATDVQRDVDHVLLARYAPPCVIVNEAFDILQFRGHTGPYLEAPTGHPQLNVLRMARGGLATELPLALDRARRTGVAVRRENIRIRDRRQEHCVHLEVVPIRGADLEPQFLVLFEPRPERVVPKQSVQRGSTREAGEADRLRQELAAAKEYMHSVVMQHLATSEELGLTNEELQSTNEELQSSNEEMQTAKEELHSTNEELETVNEELHRRNDQLGEVNDDLLNVLASVEIAMIIVDPERRVRRFTPRARSIMNLLPGDIGRPIVDLKPTIGVADLDATIAGVIESLQVHESEVEDRATSTFYRMQVRPYLTVDRTPSGAVLSFVDITALRAARNFRAAIVDTVPAPIVVLDASLCVQSANHSFCDLFGTSEAAIVGRSLLGIGEWHSPDLGKRLQTVVDGGPGLVDLEVDHRGTVGSRMLRVTANALAATGGPRSILLGIEDVTDREAARRERDAFLDAVSHELRTPLSAILLWAQALRTLDHDDPQRKTAIETIIDCVKSEARLVDDLLEVALSRSSELSLVLQIGDPAPVVASVVETSRASAGAKEITLSSDIAPGARISMDPRRFAQISTKLISNAIKFTPSHGAVAVSLSHDDGHVTLAVRDTGFGVAADRLPHVFEPFVREDGSPSRTHGGLGIGLSLVRHLVERHGGTIDVASLGVDRGSTFTVRIPTAAR